MSRDRAFAGSTGAEGRGALPALMSGMPEDHPVVPGVGYSDVAVILAVALAGAPAPHRLDGAVALRMLRAGLLACGGMEGVRRLSERDRQINLAMLRHPGRGYTAEQKRQKRAIWSGGSRREQSLIDLAFCLVNPPQVGTTTAGVEPVGVAA